MAFLKVCTAAAVLLSAIPATASPVMDDVNGSATPPFVFYAGPNNIGWYITANDTYMLDGIFTTFRPVPNGTGDHTITTQIWTDRPSQGGTLLGQGMFNIHSAVGGNAGVTFAPALITAGQQYFVNFLDTIGMGVNLGSWANDSGGNPQPCCGATVNLNHWYGESAPNNTGMFDDSTLVAGPAYYVTATGNVSFAEPILRFTGTEVPTGAVPEPSSMMLLGSALSGLVLMQSRRRS
jgi:hypothetical protein